MASFRIVWEYISSNGAQWNEVYYKDAPDPVQAASTTNSLAINRLALLHPLSKLVQIRAAQVDANRVTAIAVYNWNGTATPVSGGSTIGGPDTAGNAIICNLATSTGANRRIWLRGVPDEYIARDPSSGLDAPPALVTNALFTWFKSLQANGYGVRKVTPQAPGPLQNVKILSVDGTAKDGTSLVTLAAAPGYPFPSRVIIGGCSRKDLPGMNGRFSIISAPLGAVVHIPYQTPGGLVVTGGNGHMRQEVFLAVAIFSANNCGFHHFGTRPTKNPTSHSRGARRAVRIRTSL